MSFNLEGQKCVVCSAYLFPEDDVVHCPVCGAPHHRDCYKAVGHCGAEEFHGTENQYKFEAPENINEKEKAEDTKGQAAVSSCPRCGKALSEDSHFCPYCGTAKGADTSYIGSPFMGAFSPMSEIDKNAEIESGVTVGEAAPLIIANLSRYIAKFLKLGKRLSASWNWAAFLLPYGWFAFRKMYLPAVISGVLAIVSTLFSLPFNMAVIQLPGYNDITGGSAELVRFISDNIGNIDSLALILAGVGVLIEIALMVVCGLFGDWLYKKKVVSSALEIRSSEDRENDIRKKGGVNIFGFMIAVAVVTYLPNIISAFLI